MGICSLELDQPMSELPMLNELLVDGEIMLDDSLMLAVLHTFGMQGQRYEQGHDSEDHRFRFEELTNVCVDTFSNLLMQNTDWISLSSDAGKLIMCHVTASYLVLQMNVCSSVKYITDVRRN